MNYQEQMRLLNEQRLQLVNEARALIERAEGEKRDFSGEEQTQYDRMLADLEDLDKRAQRLQDAHEREQRLRAPQPTVVGGREMPGDGEPDPDGRTQRPGEERDVREIAKRDSAARRAFRSFIRAGFTGMDNDERRSLQMDSDPSGGFLVAPQEFVAELIMFVNDNVWVRKFSRVLTLTNAESLGVPVLASDPADSDWTSELLTGNEDTALQFGKRELRPHPLAKNIKISNKLIRSSALSVEGIVIDRLGYKFGISMEKAYLLGTGAQQPLGVFTATTDGIDTSRDINTGNTTTSIGADGVIEAKFALKENYWPKAIWIYHRSALKQIMKLKDNNNQYLWRVGGFGFALTEPMPPQLLDTPVYLSEYAPSTFTTGKYVGIIGDFSRYWIADSLQLQFQRLIELYAATNQIGYIGRLETDGMPVLAEAFARVTLA